MRFDRKITLQRPKHIDDGLGGKKHDGFADLGSARAAFIPGDIGEELKAGSYDATQKSMFVMRWSARLRGIRRGDEITGRDGRWSVIGTAEVGRRLVKISVKRVGDQ